MVKTNNYYRHKMLEKGICPQCCKNPLKTKWFCEPCLIKQREASRRHYYKYHAKNKLIKQRKRRNGRTGNQWYNVAERDGYVCQVCGNEKIIVHHIDENPQNNSIDNLICLCRPCHATIEKFNKSKPNLRKIFYWFK